MGVWCRAAVAAEAAEAATVAAARRIELHVTDHEEVRNIMLFEPLCAHQLGNLAHRLGEVGAAAPVRRLEALHLLHKGGVRLELMPRRIS